MHRWGITIDVTASEGGKYSKVLGEGEKREEVERKDVRLRVVL